MKRYSFATMCEISARLIELCESHSSINNNGKEYPRQIQRKPVTIFNPTARVERAIQNPAVVMANLTTLKATDEFHHAESIRDMLQYLRNYYPVQCNVHLVRKNECWPVLASMLIAGSGSLPMLISAAISWESSRILENSQDSFGLSILFLQCFSWYGLLIADNPSTQQQIDNGYKYEAVVWQKLKVVIVLSKKLRPFF